MDIKGTNGKTAHVTRGSLQGQSEDVKFFDFLSGALNEFTKSRPLKKTSNFYFILPDSCVAMTL